MFLNHNLSWCSALSFSSIIFKVFELLLINNSSNIAHFLSVVIMWPVYLSQIPIELWSKLIMLSLWVKIITALSVMTSKVILYTNTRMNLKINRLIFLISLILMVAFDQIERTYDQFTTGCKHPLNPDFLLLNWVNFYVKGFF